MLEDTRAVAPLVGFILLFGILIIAFAGYQVEVVPQQNAETEFDHFQQNQNELIELRSSVLSTGESGFSRFSTVVLGTNYQERIFAVNAPPPEGVIQTSEPYEITISGSEEEIVVETRFLEYRPAYNEINTGSTWYETSILYLDERDLDGGVSIIEGQEIGGDTLQIFVLQNQYQQSGLDRVTVELYPTNNEIDLSDLEGQLDVTLPTRLDEDHWEGQLEDSSAIDIVEFEDDESDEVNNLTVSADRENVELNTVGLGGEPNDRAGGNTDPHGDGGDDDENGLSLPSEADEGSGEYENDNFRTDAEWDEDGNLITSDELEYEESRAISLFSAGSVASEGGLEFDETEDIWISTVGDFTASDDIEFDHIEGEVRFETGGPVSVFDDIEIEAISDDVLLYTESSFTIDGDLEIDDVGGDVHIYVGGEVDIDDAEFDEIDGEVILYGDTDYGPLEEENDDERDVDQFPES